MDGTVDRVYFNSSSHVEACLFKPKRKAARPRKKVDADGTLISLR